MKINLKEELAAGAAGYNELLRNDWRLRLEMEAKDRMFRDKQDAKRREKNEKAKLQKRLKNKLRLVRRRF